MKRKHVPQNWQKTIISDLRWDPKLTTTKDDSLDIIIRVPLTELLERQARQSFAFGISQALLFAGEHGPEVITDAEMAAQMEAWGLSDVWAERQRRKATP